MSRVNKLFLIFVGLNLVTLFYVFSLTRTECRQVDIGCPKNLACFSPPETCSIVMHSGVFASMASLLVLIFIYFVVRAISFNKSK